MKRLKILLTFVIIFFILFSIKVYAARTVLTCGMPNPATDLTINQGGTFNITLNWTETGTGAAQTVNLRWMWNNSGVWEVIPTSSAGLTVTDNEEEGASKDTNYNRTVTGNTLGTYFVMGNAYDTGTPSDNKNSTIRKITVSDTQASTYSLNSTN